MWISTKDFIPHEELREAIFYRIDNPSLRQVDHIRKQIVVDVHCRHGSLLMVQLHKALRHFDDVLICIELRTFQQYDDGLATQIQCSELTLVRKGWQQRELSQSWHCQDLLDPIFTASCLHDWLLTNHIKAISWALHKKQLGLNFPLDGFLRALHDLEYWAIRIAFQKI